MPHGLAGNRVVVRSQSKLRRRCRIIPNRAHRCNEHSRVAHDDPTRLCGHACDAHSGHVCVARTFLNADTSRWSSQGSRRECLLHIQGLHLHCGLLESCTPFSLVSTSATTSPFAAHPTTPAVSTPWSLFFLLFLGVCVRAFRYMYIRHVPRPIAEDPTKRSTASAQPRFLFSTTFSFRFVATPTSLRFAFQTLLCELTLYV